MVYSKLHRIPSRCFWSLHILHPTWSFFSWKGYGQPTFMTASMGSCGLWWVLATTPSTTPLTDTTMATTPFSWTGFLVLFEPLLSAMRMSQRSVNRWQQWADDRLKLMMMNPRSVEGYIGTLSAAFLVCDWGGWCSWSCVNFYELVNFSLFQDWMLILEKYALWSFQLG